MNENNTHIHQHHHHHHQQQQQHRENCWPEDVGIINMEIYFPSQFVDQSELEVFDGVSTGKYTIGLGQTKMGFCTDLEDVNSLCLTVVDRLMSKTPGIGYGDIGRLEVGTETIIDKSKSVKSVLMKLFEESGNSDVEGIDCTNACYGGTAALFNCVSWIESSYWDGRFALAVCADIAVYATGNARPTGGAGAVAMLIGPRAALVLERRLRATHVQHVYDFYKPDLNSEYPVVDGKLSIQCYLSSLDKCYGLYRQKAAQICNKSEVSLRDFDSVLFHTPFCKLVQKSLGRMALNDYVNLPKEKRFAVFPEYVDIKLEETYFDKEVEKAFMNQSKEIFEAKTKPSLLIATNVGNMYTPSLYGGLVSYLVSRSSLEDLLGRRVALFSYGSGLASSFFSMKISENASTVSRILETLSDVRTRLESRKKVSPSEFAETMLLREKVHHAAPYESSAEVADLFPGTWYLSRVDERHRREYLKNSVALDHDDNIIIPPTTNGHL